MDSKLLQTLQSADDSLISELFEKNQTLKTIPLLGFEFRNKQVVKTLQQGTTTQLFELLHSKGTFDLNTETHHWKDLDGEEAELTINRASKTPMWPMGTHFWVRDNALIASSLINLNYDRFCYPLEWYEIGKKMLLSGLTIMSSQTQLGRFQAIIKDPSLATDPHNWPHIFLSINNNLNATTKEPWMHKQDAWQILLVKTLEALEKGHLKQTDLTAKHTELLQLAIPFLQAINYSSNPNGGSWEEIEAVRSSVIAWDLALIKKLESCPFIQTQDTHHLKKQGISVLKKNLPFESPQDADISYREADAALIYLLQLDTIDSLTDCDSVKIRQQIHAQLDRLLSSHGCKRYLGDSYQGLSYYRNETTVKLQAITDSPSGDSSGKEDFQLRSDTVPSGHEAEWTHFIWQLSSYYGKRFLQTNANQDKDKQLHYFHFALSLITGEEEYAIQQNDDSELEIIPIPPFRLPECYNTEMHQGKHFKYPSLHTPLYWSVAESLTAFDSLIDSPQIIKTH